MVEPELEDRYKDLNDDELSQEISCLKVWEAEVRELRQLMEEELRARLMRYAMGSLKKTLEA